MATLLNSVRHDALGALSLAHNQFQRIPEDHFDRALYKLRRHAGRFGYSPVNVLDCSNEIKRAGVALQDDPSLFSLEERTWLLFLRNYSRAGVRFRVPRRDELSALRATRNRTCRLAF